MFIPPPPDIPPVPTAPLFPKAKATIGNKELGDELRQLCTDLRSIAATPAAQEALLRCQEAVTPKGAADTGRLPYATNTANAGKSKAIFCLYASLAWAVQRYWDQCDHGNDHSAEIRGIVLDIRRIIEYARREPAINSLEAVLHRCKTGLRGCRIAGNERDGYWLEVPGE